MDTQDSGTSTEETQLGDSSTEQTDETVTDDTSADGAAEDADQLKKQLSDKDRYIKQLEKERLEGVPKKKTSVTEDQDDVITWASTHSDDLKMVSKEYQEELDFYKSHKITITNEIRDRALREARARKGLVKKPNAETLRQVATSSETVGEMRKPARTEDIPESVKKMAPTMTKEQYIAYKAEFAAKKKRG